MDQRAGIPAGRDGSPRQSRRGAGEGSIRHRPDGRWEARLRVDGKRISVLAKTQAEVQEKLQALIARTRAGYAPDITVAAYLDRWLEGRRDSLRASTWASYESTVRVQIKPAIGHKRLAALTVADVQAMLWRIGEDRAPQTVRNCRTLVSSALGDAYRSGLVARNVASLARGPHVDRYSIAPLTLADARAVLQAVRGHRLEALYVLALATGARQGELLALRWDDLDLTAGTMRIQRSIKRVAGEYVIQPPKTRTSRRTVPLPAPIVDALRHHRDRQTIARRRAANFWLGTDQHLCRRFDIPHPPRTEADRRRLESARADWGELVFTSEDGGPLHATTATRQFQVALAAVRLPPMRFHDLRHGAATLAFAGNVPARLIMEQLGHATLAGTSTYTHLHPDQMREAANAIAAALFGGPHE